MDVEWLRSYALRKPNVSECFPFDEHTLVFKKGDKIFMLMALDEFPLRVNLKCDPEWAIELRASYPEHIFPGYHMNKKHWNTVVVNGKLSPDLMQRMVDESYEKVKAKKTSA
ncbi:MAG TPA: MmcQ/YjbR family DNA-binding protein [Ferruginibacter sp.]|nr:MmcQ/YjbR family DNA-binding protein [Ferruginibacter sp.]HRN79579.1 MmcQ/YjbR family DNA-binding protein [Ferruginibacter sp.]HRO16615.1 MmcQ/YjbR family DNA-binding protein [Ferruginibacter sp.]HRQ20771.1 MmcQ/YjbR family DNA-binding protein [Ferruginibacter sp.]